MALQRLIFLFQKSILRKKDYGIYKILKITKFKSLLSTIFRIVFRFKRLFYLYMKYWKSIDLKDQLDFWVLRIGFIRKRNFSLFLKVDPFLSNEPNVCADLKNLPFTKESVQMININHFFQYFPKGNYKKVLKSWSKKLIPGGILNINVKLHNNEKNVELLKTNLRKCNFFIKDLDYYNVPINKTALIKAIKIKEVEKVPSIISNKKIENIQLILSQNLELLKNGKSLCLIGYDSAMIRDFLIQQNLKADKIKIFPDLDLIHKIQDNFYDVVILVNYLEFKNSSEYCKIFKEIRRINVPSGLVLIIIPEKKHFLIKETATIFEKGIITRILTENNFPIEWINLSSTFKLIQILIRNDFEKPLIFNGIKVCLIGNYSLRYTHLNNVFWDGQARAFEKLGYETLILDTKDHSFTYLISALKRFKPDYLWIAGKVAVQFLIKFSSYFKNSKMKVVYWFWDARIPIKNDFSNVIHTMFISSVGEIPLYQKAYNLKRVFFMPTPITPQIMHRNRFIKEKYEIGFSGQLGLTKYHKERTEIIKYLKKFFQVKIVNNVFNNIPEFYSQCKLVFGGTPYLRNFDLIASDRFYIAISCGTCHITNYVNGLEKLVTNHEHLIWYVKKEELKAIIQKYLQDTKLRLNVKLNAENLAKEKHNYLIRIKNMLDIVDGKTEEFYGFLD